MIRFAHPLLLLLIPLLAWAVWRLGKRRPSHPRMKYSSAALLTGTRRSLRVRLRRLPVLLVALAAIMVIVALARPQSPWSERKNFTQGIDIMLVIDVSDSMRALDFDPNRLEKAKAVVKDFVAGRTDDQIGIVIFGRDSFMLCPLTNDYAAIQTFIDRINFDLVNGNGTAIGMGLANAVDRLRKSPTKSKVAILLTDGENNAGRIDPLTAADMAKQFGIRVYTIGVGSLGGWVNIPIQDAFGERVVPQQFQLDVKQLTQIAQTTGGQFFHATDGDSLAKIYGQIDKMERTKIEASQTRHYDDLGQWLALPALALLLLALALENTWLRTFP